MKNKFLYRALCLFLSGTMLASVGCKDYDDDIQDLNNRVDKAVASITELRGLIEAGSVITSVEKTDSGVTVKLSDGSSYTLTNGEKGQDAVVWTIGDDGYWYKDNAKTDYKAIGVDGAKGDKGDKGDQGDKGEPGDKGEAGNDGENGNDGEDGIYYVPNTKTGLFDIYKGGEFVEESDISWTLSAGVTAVLEGNTLRLKNVSGTDNDVVITLGAQLGSVAFVPEVMSSTVAYPTTTDKFYHVATYVSEDKFSADRTFVPQNGWDKSNEVAMVYRLNPTDAYVNGAKAVFVNRDVTTRAAAFNDESDLLNIVDGSFVFGEAGDVTLKATVNPRAMSNDINIAALQIWAGQNPVTSDYIHIATEAISPVIANTKKTQSGNTASEFYNRHKSIKGGETDAFVKEFAGAVEATAAHFAFKYDGSIDLKPLAALYTNNVKKYMTEIGFTGISYEFSKPAEYKAADDKKTNQQAYITLEDGVVSVNSEYGTSAIGRTPVVRVDAFMTANNGAKVLVASAYIKLSISRNDPSIDDKEANSIKISDALNVSYRDIAYAQGDADMLIADMPWERISKEVYDVEGLTSTDFWNYYGGATKTYNVKVSVSGAKKNDVLIDQNVAAGNAFDTKASGVRVQVKLNNDAQTTSHVKVSVDDNVLTDHTYGDGGAKYKVEITVLSNDKKVHGDFVLTQEFTVTDNCPHYTFNPLYHATRDSAYGSIAGVTNDDLIVVKGQVDATLNSWVMSSVVSEHFINKNGVNIFGYCANDTEVRKVKSIGFAWVENPVKGVTPATAQTADFEVALDGAMTGEYLVKAMRLTQNLTNGEKCSYDYDIIFVNPFVAGNAEALKIYGNGIGAQTIDVKPEVRVIDNDSDAIYTYDAATKSLVLSSKATGDYKVVAANVSVAYAFDKEAGDYKTVMDNLSKGSTLDVDASTGVVTWNNEGATLMQNYNLTVMATVTFEDLSVVECRIPVTLSATK